MEKLAALIIVILIVASICVCVVVFNLIKIPDLTNSVEFPTVSKELLIWWLIGIAVIVAKRGRRNI